MYMIVASLFRAEGLARLGRESSGASMVEYALLVTFIALACIAAATVLGQAVATVFTNTAAAL